MTMTITHVISEVLYCDAEVARKVPLRVKKSRRAGKSRNSGWDITCSNHSCKWYLKERDDHTAAVCINSKTSLTRTTKQASRDKEIHHRPFGDTRTTNITLDMPRARGTTGSRNTHCASRACFSADAFCCAAPDTLTSPEVSECARHAGTWTCGNSFFRYAANCSKSATVRATGGRASSEDIDVPRAPRRLPTPPPLLADPRNGVVHATVNVIGLRNTASGLVTVTRTWFALPPRCASMCGKYGRRAALPPRELDGLAAGKLRPACWAEEVVVVVVVVGLLDPLLVLAELRWLCDLSLIHI